MYVRPESAMTEHSPWIAVDLAADRVAWARLLRRAHEVALSGRGTPPVLRDVIVRSWERCAVAEVDPDRPAPLLLDADQAASRFATHPLAPVVPIVRDMLGAATADARHLMAIGDADGLLLWSDGHPSMLEAAVAPHFVPGALWSEAAAGTNAVGTALAVDHPVQIFSAEHFNRLLHGWSCAAAPIHDSATGAALGAVALSCSFRHAHPHTLSLVTAVARMAEAHLARERRRRDDALTARYVERLAAAGRRPSALVSGDGRILAASPRGWLADPADVLATGGRVARAERAVVEPLDDGARIVWGARARQRHVPRPRVSVRALGAEPTTVRIDGRGVTLSARHAEVVVLLTLEPAGLSAGALARGLYGPAAKPVTVRAELTRLRRSLGDLLAARPYRLAGDVRADFLDVERALRRGSLDAALAMYAGPLLPASRAPAIVAARARLEAALDGALRPANGSALAPGGGRRTGAQTA
jgi:hypothetical protein